MLGASVTAHGSLGSVSASVSPQLFAARKRPPLQPRDRNVAYNNPSAALMADNSLHAGSGGGSGNESAAQTGTASIAAMLDTDDPFNTRKKSSALAMDELPIGGNRAAQSLAPAYFDQPAPDSDNYDSALPSSGGNSSSGSSDRDGSSASSPAVGGSRRPPLRARVRPDRTKPQTDRNEHKDDSGPAAATAGRRPAAEVADEPPVDSTVAAGPAPYKAVAARHQRAADVDTDDIPLPRSSAATLLAMLDTDDPFNSKKKSSSLAMSEDEPITGDRAAQRGPTSFKVAEDETKEDSEQTTESAFSQPIIPAKRKPPPALRSRMKQQLQQQAGDTAEAAAVPALIDDGTQSAAVEEPLFSKHTVATSNTAEVPSQGEAAGASAADAATAVQFDDAPLPRSSAAALAAMLDTDDPFNSRKKSSAVTLDDQPIGGSRTAQQMSNTAWTDDSARAADQQLSDQPTASTRRPPIHARQKVVSPALDGQQQADVSVPSDAMAEEHSAASASAPRRLPIKTKQKADKDKAAATVTSSAVDDKKKPSSGSAATAAAHTVKFDAYKGDALMDAAEADAEIATVLSAGTLALLQSKKWTEAVEGLQAVTSEAEEHGPDTFTPHLPALLSVLSRSPTFKPANFNVCRAVYDCYAACLKLYLHSQQSSFHIALAYHPLADVLNKLAEAKVVDNACALLSVMAECAGPRFMYNHVAAVITKEAFKSVKAIEAALQWLSAAIEQYGVGSLDVLALIDQCAQWMQSTSKAVKDSTLLILLTVYKQTGALFQEKMMLNLKPAAQKELESLMAAVPPEVVGKLAATKWKKGESGPAAINVDALVPRVDISGQVTDKLLKKLNDDNWKERKEAMDELEAAIKQANSRIQPKDGGALEVIGKWRLVDKNKNLSRDALSLVALFCQAMGKPIAAYRDKLVPNLFLCVADSKKLVKDEAMRTVGVWVETAGLASVAKYLPKALSAAGSRKELLDVMAASMADDRKLRREKKDMELDELIPPVIACMQDKTAEVRLAAEKVAELLARQVGVDALIDELKNLKKAEVLALRPVLDKIKRTVEAATDTPHSATATQHQQRQEEADEKDSKAAGAAKRSTGVAKTVSALKGKAGGSNSGTLKKGALDASVKAGDADAAPTSQSSSAAVSGSGSGGGSGELIKRIDLPAKSVRVKKDSKRVKGSFREWGSDELEEMSERMRDLLADSFHGQLFHKDFAKQMLALDAMEQLITANLDALISVSDLAFKWTSWRMCDANTAMLLKLVSFLTHMFSALLAVGYTLHEGEANNVLPFVIEKVLGHNNAKFRQDSKELLRLACRLYDDKAVFALVAAGMDSKNKRVQSECIELAAEIVLQYGMAVGDTKRVTLAVAMQVGASDAAVRAAALNALGQLYEKYGETVYALMGGRKPAECKVPPKQMAMIEARLKTIKPIPADEQQSISSAALLQQTATAAGKTPKKHSPPASVTASPRLPLKQQTAAGLMAGRTPVKGHTASTSSSARFTGAAQSFDDDGSYEAHEDSTVSSAAAAEANSSVPVPSSTVAFGSRKSFTANAISSDLPSCFSLDLDSSNSSGSGGHNAASQQPYDLLANAVSTSGSSSSYSNSLSRPLTAFTSHALSSTSAFSLRPSSSASSYPYSSPSSALPSNGGLHTVPLPASPLPTAVSRHSLSFTSPSAPLNPLAASAAGRTLSTSGMVASLSARLSTSGSEERIDVMKELWESIIASRASIVEGEVDEVVRFLCDQIEVSFAPLHDGSGYQCSVLNHRYCRYALNTLMELFKLPALIAELSVATLARVSYQLLVRLMDERGKSNVAADAQSKQLMQAINVLVLKVMENSDRTAILHVLIQALTQVAAEAAAGLPADGALAPRVAGGVDPLPSACFHSGFVDLLVRCLSKLIRTFQQTGMHNIDTDCLLRDIHRFLLLHQPASESNGSNGQTGTATATASSLATEQSVRAVRSVLAVLVSVKGEGVVADISGLLPANSPVLTFAERTIANWKAKNGASAMSGTQQFTPNYRSAAVAQSQHNPQLSQSALSVPDAAAEAEAGDRSSGLLPTHSLLSSSSSSSASSLASSTPSTRLSFGPRHTGAASLPGNPSAALSPAASTAASQPRFVQSYSSVAALVEAVLNPSIAASALSQLSEFQSVHRDVDVQSAFVGQSEALQSLVRRQLALSAHTAHSASASQQLRHSLHRKQPSLTDTSALRERLAALQTRARVTSSMGAAEPSQPPPQPHSQPQQPYTAQQHPLSHSRTSSGAASGSTLQSFSAPSASPSPPVAPVAADSRSLSAAAPARSSLSAADSSAPSSAASIDAIKQRYLALRRHD